MVSIEDMSESEGRKWVQYIDESGEAEPAGFGSFLMEQLRLISRQNGGTEDIQILNAEDYLDNGIVKKDQAS